MLLHCSYYDIIYPCLLYYFWAYSLTYLPCQFHMLFLPLVSATQHSCWASSYNFSGFLGSFYSLGIFSPFHSLGILGPLHYFILLTFPWTFAKSFRLPKPNCHILYLWVYWPSNQSHLLIPLFGLLPPIFAFFLFLMILMSLLNSLEILWARLLSLGHLSIL